jgi:type I restriction enzyme S subunit
MREGWEDCNLEDYIKLIDYRGRTPVKTKKGVRLVTAKNVKLGYLQLEPQEFINPDMYDLWMTRGKPNYGDVIFTTEAPLGNVAQIDTNEKLAFAQRIIVMQPEKNKINQTFLKYLLLSETIRKIILESGTGATVTGIKSSLLKKIPISIPPLPEQKRIVSILDEAFAAIAKAKDNIEKNLQNAKELFECYLQNVFIENENNSKMVPLGELTKLSRGHNPPKSKFSTIKKDGYVRFYQIRDGWSEKNAVYVPITPQLHLAKPDDILMVAYRHIGNAFRGVSGAFNVALCKISNINKDILDDDYLFQLIPSSFVKGELLKRSERSLIPSMSVEHLKEIKIPLPSLKKQKLIIQHLTKLSIETKRLEAIYQQKLQNLEELKKSLLQKAFTGELTASISQQKVFSATAKVISLSPTDMQAGIITLALHKHNNAGTAHTFGHVKSEKIVNTVQYILGLELDRNSQKDAAGPNDFKQLIKVESRAGKAGFFYVNKRNGRYDYTIGSKADSLLDKLKTTLGTQWNSLSAIVDLFVPMKTQQAEIVATVFAAWNNLLIDGRSASEEEIVYEAREGWHPGKLNIPRDSFFKAISWMKKNDLVPKGTGKKVISKSTS